MKSRFCILLVMLSLCAFAQKGELLMKANGLPVRDGNIYKFISISTHYGMSQQDGIEIISATDSVFSVIDGTVRDVYNIGGDTMVMVMNTKASLFFTFFSLGRVSIKNGDKIKKGDFLGLLKPDDDNSPNLRFMISDNKGSLLGEDKTIAFLKKINPIICTPNEQPIVAR